MDSIDGMIKKAVKEAAQEAFATPPILLKKATVAKLLDISVDQIEKLSRGRNALFREEVHYTRLTPGGYPMYFYEAVKKAVTPKLVDRG